MDRDIRHITASMLLGATAAVLFSLAVLHGCSVPKWNTCCRHEAVICALTAREHGVPHEIWVGEAEGGGRHAQTRALMDGHWYWMQWDYMDHGVVFFTEKDKFTPEYKTTIDRAVDHWFCVKE